MGKGYGCAEDVIVDYGVSVGTAGDRGKADAVLEGQTASCQSLSANYTNNIHDLYDADDLDDAGGKGCMDGFLLDAALTEFMGCGLRFGLSSGIGGIGSGDNSDLLYDIPYQVFQENSGSVSGSLDDLVKGSEVARRKKGGRWKRREHFSDLVEELSEEEYTELYKELERMRPRTRAECRNIPRPCIFVGCRYHLGITFNPKTGDYHINHKDGLFSMAESCALDMAEKGGLTLEAVGEALNITRERVRQIEKLAMRKLKKFSCRKEMRELYEDITKD